MAEKMQISARGSACDLTQFICRLLFRFCRKRTGTDKNQHLFPAGEDLQLRLERQGLPVLDQGTADQREQGIVGERLSGG